MPLILEASLPIQTVSLVVHLRPLVSGKSARRSVMKARYPYVFPEKFTTRLEQIEGVSMALRIRDDLIELVLEGIRPEMIPDEVERVRKKAQNILKRSLPGRKREIALDGFFWHGVTFSFPGLRCRREWHNLKLEWKRSDGRWFELAVRSLREGKIRIRQGLPRTLTDRERKEVKELTESFPVLEGEIEVSAEITGSEETRMK